jgi:hypothetical protein
VKEEPENAAFSSALEIGITIAIYVRFLFNKIFVKAFFTSSWNVYTFAWYTIAFEVFALLVHN